MRDLLLSIYLRVKEMPLLLRFFFIVSICGIFFALFSVIPISSYQIDGQEATYQEWWSSGVGLAATAIGILLFISGIGIYKKKNWAKFTFLSSFLISFLSDYILPQKGMIFILTFWTLFCVWYLFIKKSVRNYFLSEAKTQE